MTLQINGEPRDFPDGLTIASLVATLGMKPDRVAVELNLEIVPRANWQTAELKDGDKLEVVHFVGGGSPDQGEAAQPAASALATAVEPVEEGAWTCPSCGTSNCSKFCSGCGEKKASREDFSLRHFFSHVLEAFFHGDSKVFRSFRVLFTGPGLLAAEYARGRRKPYLHPLQVFFVANLAYFLLQPLTHWTGLRTPLYVHMHMMSYSSFASRLVEHRIAAKGISLGEFTRAFDHVVDLQARSLVLLLVPALALVLWALEWRKRQFFGEHLVFALHFYAFWLIFMFLVLYGGSMPILVLLVRSGISFNEHAIDATLYHIGQAGLAVYLFLALRAFYRDNVVAAVLKSAAVVFAVDYLLALYRFILFVTALYSA